MSLTACQNSSSSSNTAGDGNGDPTQVSKTETFGYRYSMNGCDTLPRLALSRAQLCKNLQVNSSNNGCSLERRKMMFEESCPGQSWDVAAAELAIESVKGAHSNCFVSDKASLESLRNGDAYINVQYLTDRVSAIPHEAFVTVVTQQLKDGVFKINVQIRKDDLKGAVLAEKTEEWRDQKPTMVAVETANPPAKVVCYPSIH